MASGVGLYAVEIYLRSLDAARLEGTSIMPSEYDERPTKVFNVRTQFGKDSKKGAVVFEYEGKDLVTLEPGDARRIAISILRACEGAETDEFVMKYFGGTLGLSTPEVLSILRKFREFRVLRDSAESEGRS